MKLEATVQEIETLVKMAELDLRATEIPVAKYRSHREASRKRLSKTVLERYETLVDVGRTPAVVAIDHGACSGCHVRLPTLLEFKAKRSVAIYNCPHCHRMLYAPEWFAGSCEVELRRAK